MLLNKVFFQAYIAIINFPGVHNISSTWNDLCNGHEFRYIYTRQKVNFPRCRKVLLPSRQSKIFYTFHSFT